jgi:hypothetical protein
MIKKVFISISGLFCCLLSFSQYTPQWLYSVPKSSATYYYRVSSATATTEDFALKKAFATAIYESAFAIGMAVDVGKLEAMSEDSTNLALSKFVNIPINVVCKYVEPLTTRTGYRAYVLCQVAKDARTIPTYREFNCFLNKEEE